MRRLHWFEALGCRLSDGLAVLKDGIRSRDRRSTIREPMPEFGSTAAEEPRVEQEGGYWIRVRS